MSVVGRPLHNARVQFHCDVKNKGTGRDAIVGVSPSPSNKRLRDSHPATTHGDGARRDFEFSGRRQMPPSMAKAAPKSQWDEHPPRELAPSNASSDAEVVWGRPKLHMIRGNLERMSEMTTVSGA